MKKVTVYLKVRLNINLEKGKLIDDVIQEMDYKFTSMTTGADITDTDIDDYEVVE